MSILIHVAAQEAARKLDAVNAELARLDRSTPEPVYSDPPPIQPPTRLAAHEQTRALAAMHHARQRYPGPVADVLVEAIAAYKELGCIGQPSAPVVRLIRELTR